LATVKDELSIKTEDTKKDAFLGRAIVQISAAIKNYCNRVFHPEWLSDAITFEDGAAGWATAGNPLHLLPSKWPLIAVNSVQQLTSVGVLTPLVLGTDYSIDYDNGRLFRLNPTTGAPMVWESWPVTIDHVAGYGASVSEAFTVPATPYQVTVAKASSFAVDRGVTYSGGAALTKVTGTPAIGQYAVDPSTGKYTFAAADLAASVIGSYAYSVIPDDVVDAALRLCTMRYKARGRDPMVIQRDQPGGVGSERLWFSNDDGGFTPEIRGIIDNYRIFVVA
jgi:hypothetical protein